MSELAGSSNEEGKNPSSRAGSVVYGQGVPLLSHLRRARSSSPIRRPPVDESRPVLHNVNPVGSRYPARLRYAPIMTSIRDFKGRLKAFEEKYPRPRPHNFDADLHSKKRLEAQVEFARLESLCGDIIKRLPAAGHTDQRRYLEMDMTNCRAKFWKFYDFTPPPPPEVLPRSTPRTEGVSSSTGNLLAFSPSGNTQIEVQESPLQLAHEPPAFESLVPPSPRRVPSRISSHASLSPIPSPTHTTEARSQPENSAWLQEYHAQEQAIEFYLQKINERLPTRAPPARMSTDSTAHSKMDQWLRSLSNIESILRRTRLQLHPSSTKCDENESIALGEDHASFAERINPQLDDHDPAAYYGDRKTFSPHHISWTP